MAPVVAAVGVARVISLHPSRWPPSRIQYHKALPTTLTRSDKLIEVGALPLHHYTVSMETFVSNFIIV
jgi:hypothetical protein